MGLLDSILGKGQGGADTKSALVNAIVSMIGSQQGGLDGLVQQLAGKGLGDVVNSWVSTGKNLPVSGDQLKGALGGKTIADLASKTGISPDKLMPQLTQLLPQVVDKLTPDGKIPQGDIVSQGLGLLKGLMK